jgi:hypothetical protein
MYGTNEGGRKEGKLSRLEGGTEGKWWY